MSMCHVPRLFKLLAVLASVVMAGCASSVARVDTWEGQLPATTKPAVLQAPGEIQVVSVNGRNMTNFLIEDLALDYGLLPGENEVVFRYKTIWAKSGVVRNGESKVHVIECSTQVARFTASPRPRVCVWTLGRASRRSAKRTPRRSRSARAARCSR